MRQPAVTRRIRRVLIGVIVLGVVVFVARSFAGRTLREPERALVGTWTFLEPSRPDTRIVYRFYSNGRATEEHYCLKSASPTVPAIRTEGVWELDTDGTLIVDSA
jgi:hypothetical protein